MLPSIGAISLSQVSAELGLSANAQISLNDAGVRSLFGVPSGAIGMQSGRGKYLFGPVNIRSRMLAIVRFGSFTYVALGTDIYRFTTPTGLWTRVYTGTSDIRRMHANASRIVVLNAFGNNTLTSTNGTTWTAGTLPGNNNSWNNLTASPSLFVVVGPNGSIATSSDGITWTSRSLGISNSINGVAWSGTIFAAVGQNGLVRTSPDGITWTAQSYPLNTLIHSIAWGAGVFVVNDASGTQNGALRSSPTAATGSWSFRGSQATGTLVFTGSRFMLLRQGQLRTSTNGTSWPGSDTILPSVTSTADIVEGATWDGSQFLITTGSTSTLQPGVVYTSPDATTWTSVMAQPFGKGVTGLAFGHGFYMATWSDGIATSSNEGASWTIRNIPSFAPNGIASNGSISVVVGPSGNILKSTDGINWTASTSGVSVPLFRVIWTGSRFIVRGGSGTSSIVITSADGISWSAASGLPAASSNVLVANASVAILSVGGDIYRSTNQGQSWSLAYTSAIFFSGGAWNGTVFVANAGNGVVKTSPDGITWTQRNSISGWFLNVVAASGGVFIASDTINSGANRLAVSTDNGVTWTSVLPAGGQQIRAQAFGVNNNTVLIGGTQGEIWSTGLPNIATRPSIA